MGFMRLHNALASERESLKGVFGGPTAAYLAEPYSWLSGLETIRVEEGSIAQLDQFNTHLLFACCCSPIITSQYIHSLKNVLCGHVIEFQNSGSLYIIEFERSSDPVVSPT